MLVHFVEAKANDTGVIELEMGIMLVHFVEAKANDTGVIELEMGMIEN